MIIPFNKQKAQPQNQPSEELMLMALAHMRDIGRIPDASQRTKPKAPPSSQPVDLSNG